MSRAQPSEPQAPRAHARQGLRRHHGRLAALAAGHLRGRWAVVCHTSASLTIQDNADPNVRRDLMTTLEGLAPEDAPYAHAEEGPDDMPSHIKSMLTEVSLGIPVTG